MIHLFIFLFCVVLVGRTQHLLRLGPDCGMEHNLCPQMLCFKMKHEMVEDESEMD